MSKFNCLGCVLIARHVHEDIYLKHKPYEMQVIIHSRGFPTSDSFCTNTSQAEVLRTVFDNLCQKAPHYDHDCSDCIFVGCYDKLDVYICPGVRANDRGDLIFRFGSEGHQYLSYPIDMVDDKKLKSIPNFLESNFNCKP